MFRFRVQVHYQVHSGLSRFWW